MKILAHRGFWTAREQGNTRQAFRHAFDRGYGVELDVRDAAGSVVVSHDPPIKDDVPLLFSDVLSDFVESGTPGHIAINVKADGLAQMIVALLAQYPAASARSFVFDMSVPELARYTRTGLTVFSRHSDYEPTIALVDRVAGVWLDCFDGPAVAASQILDVLRKSKSAAIVSPELHNLPHEAAWAQWRAALSADPTELFSQQLFLCTDYPDEAERFFAA